MAHQHGHQYDPREAAKGEQPSPQPRRHPRSQCADPEKQRAEHQQQYSWGAERQKGEVQIRCVVLPESAEGAQYASEEAHTEAPLLQPPCASPCRECRASTPANAYSGDLLGDGEVLVMRTI